VAGFTFSCPGESNRPSSLPSITPLQQTLGNIDNKNSESLKSLLQLINSKHQRFKSFISQTTSIKLEHMSRNAEKKNK